MITENDWKIMLITEHFLITDTLTREEYLKIITEAEDKVKFKDGLE